MMFVMGSPALTLFLLLTRLGYTPPRLIVVSALSELLVVSMNRGFAFDSNVCFTHEVNGQ